MSFVKDLVSAAFQAGDHKFDAKTSATGRIISLYGGTVKVRGQKFPARECTAEVLVGGTSERMTATRLAGGALVGGQAGAIIGGMATKDTSRGYLVVTTPAGRESFKLTGGEIATAQNFALSLSMEHDRAA